MKPSKAILEFAKQMHEDYRLFAKSQGRGDWTWDSLSPFQQQAYIYGAKAILRRMKRKENQRES